MMLNKQTIIDSTTKAINLLHTDKAEEISDFADFVSKRYEEQQLAQVIKKLAAESQEFAF
jgi:chloramphenicol O-acetyltransferase